VLPLKRVAVIGNGDGVLRELLKHSTIHVVKIFAVDDKESLSSSSFYEPRIDVGHVDSLLQTSTPLRKDPTTKNITTFQDSVFDVMIVQNYPKEFGLSTDASFFRASYDALSNNGVLVLPLGAVLNEDGWMTSKNR
jgi:spermidine synthase